MRYWYMRLAVFLGALAVPARCLCQAWTFALAPDPGTTLVDCLGLAALVL
ncbi:protein-methionine-sulfoxide reductase heme-binding subunit MsrQ, partial [Pseudomonas aeruginosa]